MNFKKPYPRHHRKTSDKKDSPVWSRPKDVQGRKQSNQDFKKLKLEMEK